MATNEDGTEVLETPVETDGGTVETPQEPELTAEQLAELKGKAAKADELEAKNKQLFERAKKAEAEVPSKTLGELSSKDILFLSKTDVHEADLDTVLDWAKFKKISVPEAHKELKAVLEVRAQERKTAEATNTKGGARGAAKVAPEDLLESARRGEEIDPTDENFQDIFKARLARKTSRVKR